jgi:serine/threonine-protein phosphatase 5
LQEAQDPKINAKLYSNRALCNFKLKNYGKVIEDCKTAITLNPSFIKPYYRLMQACFLLEKYEEGDQFAKRALQ